MFPSPPAHLANTHSPTHTHSIHEASQRHTHSIHEALRLHVYISPRNQHCPWALCLSEQDLPLLRSWGTPANIENTESNTEGVAQQNNSCLYIVNAGRNHVECWNLLCCGASGFRITQSKPRNYQVDSGMRPFNSASRTKSCTTMKGRNHASPHRHQIKTCAYLRVEPRQPGGGATPTPIATLKVSPPLKKTQCVALY